MWEMLFAPLLWGVIAIFVTNHLLLKVPVRVTVPVCIAAFGALYADGEALVSLPLRERQARLKQILPELRLGYVELARSIEVVADAAATAAAAAAPGSDDKGATGTAAVSGASDASGSSAKCLAAPSAAAEAVATDTASEQTATSAATPSVSEEAVGNAPSEEAGNSDAESAGGGGPAMAAGELGKPAAGANVRGSDGVPVEAIEADEQTQDAVAKVQEFLLESFARGTEGLMLKRLDDGASYQPSKRSESWIKIKRDYCEGLRDSLDQVPIGGWYGNGRKAGWVSPFLLAAWDPETETLASVCRCMSGFTDAFYAEASERLRARQLPGPKPYYVTGEWPDMWFDSTEVWEIRGADLTISPVHKAAAGRLHPERGVSLRFPRFIWLRPDKTVEEATGPDVIEDLYSRQTQRMQTAQECPAHGAVKAMADGRKAADED